MAIDKVFERTSETNLTNLIGNLSVPAAFFEFKDFNIFSASSEITKNVYSLNSKNDSQHSHHKSCHFLTPTSSLLNSD